MAVRLKLAALALSVLLALLPAAALASCKLQAVSIRKQGACHVLGGRRNLAGFQVAHPPAVCCEFPPGKPLHSTVAETPSSATDVLSPTFAVLTLAAPLMHREAIPTPPRIRSSGSGLHAVLCTFLI